VEGLRLDPHPDLWWTLLYGGVFASGVANVLWFSLLLRREAVVVAAYVFLVPLFAVLFGALTLAERLPPLALGGGLLVVLGLFLVSAPRTRVLSNE
jgi:drug/metabolite transporter (DMT)-like permease